MDYWLYYMTAYLILYTNFNQNSKQSVLTGYVGRKENYE